jgi:hypothetical protein
MPGRGVAGNAWCIEVGKRRIGVGRWARRRELHWLWLGSAGAHARGVGGWRAECSRRGVRPRVRVTSVGVGSGGEVMVANLFPWSQSFPMRLHRLGVALNSWRVILAGLLAFLASGCSPLYLVSAISSEPGVTAHPNHRHGTGPRHQIDIYTPTVTPAKRRPVVNKFDPPLLWLYGTYRLRTVSPDAQRPHSGAEQAGVAPLAVGPLECVAPHELKGERIPMRSYWLQFDYRLQASAN